MSNTPKCCSACANEPRYIRTGGAVCLNESCNCHKEQKEYQTCEHGGTNLKECTFGICSKEQECIACGFPHRKDYDCAAKEQEKCEHKNKGNCLACYNNFITPTEPEASWEETLREKVDYDPAEIGCEWDLDDIISFIRSTLATQEKRLRAEILEKITGMTKEIDYETYCGCDGECFGDCKKSYNQALVDAAKIVKEK